MRVLLVEPDYKSNSIQALKMAEEAKTTPRKKKEDESLWYPPLGLMKLATFHKNRGDEVQFLYGCNKAIFKEADLFSPANLWDRVYISTLFTFQWDKTFRTINFYKDAVGGSTSKIIVGGIMASLMPEQINRATNIVPVTGVINSPQKIFLQGDENIDLLPPDYEILDKNLYAINDTYYGYTTRGCVRKCPFCGVAEIEPKYIDYIDIKVIISQLREKYGDKPRLKLMDNNVLASKHLERIIEDLLGLGYGRGNFINGNPRRVRSIDFNQGLDASRITAKSMPLLAKLNIRPMRIAFDKLKDKDNYIRAVELARKHGVTDFSNYMLYNWRDTPRDLYERLIINIELNEKWRKGEVKRGPQIYSYPMRYAPIKEIDDSESSRKRDYSPSIRKGEHDYLKEAVWTPKFRRNIEIMKGAAFGAISPTPTLARRAIGNNYEEFISNLYMPSELLRNRDKYEKQIYKEKSPGTGDIEKFRKFILKHLKKPNKSFPDLYEAIAQNSKATIRGYLKKCVDNEERKWLEFYLK